MRCCCCHLGQKRKDLQGGGHDVRPLLVVVEDAGTEEGKKKKWEGAQWQGTND